MIDKKYRGRFTVFLGITGALFLFILIKYADLMLIRPVSNAYSSYSRVEVERGPILDRNGELLAIQHKLNRVEASPKLVTDDGETAALLAKILDVDAEKLKKAFANKDAEYYSIKRKISDDESFQIRVEKEAGRLNGIYLTPEYGRYYPENELACHVLGFTGTDNVGLNGIEYELDDYLSPKDFPETDDTVYGNKVYLTLDVNIQYFAEKIVRETQQKEDADYACMIVADARSADILAYAAAPGFNPNRYNEYPEETWRNIPLNMPYEPGSVFKVFSVAAFLELGGITPSSEFFCDGYYEAESADGNVETIKCLGHHGWVTPRDIIKYSCNAGAAYASETVSSRDLYRIFTDFGFGVKTYLPMPGETAGFLRRPEQWSFRSKATLAIGQELSVSAVQMVRAATALTNEGEVLTPHIVRKIVSPDGEVLVQTERSSDGRILSPIIAEEMLLSMEAATDTDSTAWRSRVEGIRISSKTGTAQIYEATTGRYSDDAFLASCLTIFPTDNPAVIIYTIVSHPKAGEIYGGRIAAPMNREMADRLIPYLGLVREQDTVYEHSGTIVIQRRPELTLEEHVPDFTGYSKREILPLLGQDRVDFLLLGEGWVVKQEPAAGTPVTEDTVIRLVFE